MILELRNVNKSFPGVKALTDMNFQLEKGEVHALLGENGAGKSTMIKIISGLYQPDTGEILIEGERQTFAGSADSIKAGIGVVYQEINAFSNLPIMENIFVGRLPVKKPFGVDHRKMKEEARRVYASLGMNVDVEQSAAALSIADRQMLAIAKALSMNSKILILDEPTAALSATEVESLFSTVRRLKQEGVSIIFISHRMEEIFQIADRVTVIRDGNYIGTRQVAETGTEELVSMMVGRTVENYYPKIDANIGDVILEAAHISDGGIVKDVSFALRKGEILGISGLAGAGRTETVTSLVGLRPRLSGTIQLNGKEINIRNYKEALENGIVYVSEDRQGNGLTIPMSVKDNISLAGLKKFVKRGFIDKKADIANAENFIDRISIAAPGYNFVVENLSGGNQQKVSVAKALSTDAPKIIILDEPTRGVDVGAKTEIYTLINELIKEGMSVIMISSELPEILGMSDRIVVLHEGRVSGIVDRKELMNQEYILSLAFGAKKEAAEAS